MSESQVVSAASLMELVGEIKLLLAAGWQVKGTVVQDAETNQYTQAMVK